MSKAPNRAERRRARAAPQAQAPLPPLEQIRKALSESAGGAAIPDPVEGVKALLVQHTVLIGKYERTRELLQLEWTQKRRT